MVGVNAPLSVSFAKCGTVVGVNACTDSAKCGMVVGVNVCTDSAKCGMVVGVNACTDAAKCGTVVGVNACTDSRSLRRLQCKDVTELALRLSKEPSSLKENISS